jgi:hypothetical protein
MPGRKAANFAADRTRRYDNRPLDHIKDVISPLDCQSVATFPVSRLMLRGSPQRHYLAGRRCCAEVPQASISLRRFSKSWLALPKESAGADHARVPPAHPSSRAATRAGPTPLKKGSGARPRSTRPRPAAARGTRDIGGGMGAALNTAAAMSAYTLSDRGTWLSFGNKGDLTVLVEGDPRLLNRYDVILLDPKKHPEAKAKPRSAPMALMASSCSIPPPPPQNKRVGLIEG